MYFFLQFLFQSFLIRLTTWTVPIKTREDTEAIVDAYGQEIYLTNLLLHTFEGTVSTFRNIVFSYWIFPWQIMIFHVRIPLSKVISAIYWNMELRFRVSKLIFFRGESRVETKSFQHNWLLLFTEKQCVHFNSSLLISLSKILKILVAPSYSHSSSDYSVSSSSFCLTKNAIVSFDTCRKLQSWRHSFVSSCSKGSTETNGLRFSRSLVPFSIALVIPEDYQPLNIISAPFCKVR